MMSRLVSKRLFLPSFLPLSSIVLSARAEKKEEIRKRTRRERLRQVKKEDWAHETGLGRRLVPKSLST